MQLVIIFYMLKKLLLLPQKHFFFELRPLSLNVQLLGSTAATLLDQCFSTFIMLCPSDIVDVVTQKGL